MKKRLMALAGAVALGFSAGAAGGVATDTIRTSGGEYVLNLQLPEGGMLSPQKITEIEE